MEKFANSTFERAVLGGMISYRGIIEEYEGELSPSLFYYDDSKDIYEAIMYLYKNNKAISEATVVERLRQKDQLEFVRGKEYIYSLKDDIINKYFFGPYINELKELAYKRLVAEEAQKLLEGLEGDEDINTLLDKFERATEPSTTSEDDNSLVGIMGNIFNELEDGKMIDKVKTGIPVIDKCTNGIAPSELVTIGAKSGVGKSALAVRIAINMYKEGKKVLIVSREMSKRQVAERILLAHSGVTKEQYENRDFDDKAWVKIVETMEMFSTDDIIIDDKISTIQEIKQAVRHFKPDVLIVDYVQLLTPNNPKDSRERQVADISRELKKMTSDFEMIVIQLTQLAEKGIGNYKPSGESYTRESRAIYHDSNCVIYVHHVTEEKEIEIAQNRTVLKERQNKEETKEMLKRLEGIGTRLVEVIVDKNRSGSVGSDYYWFSGKEMSYYPIV